MNSTIRYLFNMKRIFVVIFKCICNFRNLTSYCPSEWCTEESGVCQWIPQFCIFLQFCNFAFLQLLHPHPRVSIYAKSSSLLVHLKKKKSEPEGASFSHISPKEKNRNRSNTHSTNRLWSSCCKGFHLVSLLLLPIEVVRLDWENQVLTKQRERKTSQCPFYQEQTITIWVEEASNYVV